MVTEHVGEHVEHYPPVDAGLHIFAFTVSAALESCIPDKTQDVTRHARGGSGVGLCG